MDDSSIAALARVNNRGRSPALQGLKQLYFIVAALLSTMRTHTLATIALTTRFAAGLTHVRYELKTNRADGRSIFFGRHMYGASTVTSAMLQLLLIVVRPLRMRICGAP